MGLYRAYPEKDNFITNKALQFDESVRATGSNHGASPALAVFAQKNRISSASLELARALLKFNLTELSGKIYTDKTIPSSSVSYFLKMYDMAHDETVPTSYELFVYPLSKDWDEGNGIDIDKFKDSGFSNWLSASSTQTWTNSGSDFITNSGSGSQRFDRGDEDLEVNVTDLVINWLTGSFANNGVVVKLGSTEENNSIDYYKKLFHSHETKFVDRLPYIEARWNDVLKDNRGNFGYGVENKLYMYNVVRGELTFAREPITVKVIDHLSSSFQRFSQSYSAVQLQSGVFSASITIQNTASFSSTFYDVWFSGSTVYMTSSFTPLFLTASSVDQYNEFTINVNNLKRTYKLSEEARLKVNVRKKNYVTHRYVSTASLDMPKEYIEKMYYSIINDESGEVVIPFGTGSIAYTQLSYNGDGNYLNMYMNSFVPGFAYRFLFMVDINQYDKKIYDDSWIFRVV